EVERCARHHDQKFFAAPAAQDVLGANGLAANACKLLQYSVSAGMAEAVIDALEMVEIEHGDGQRQVGFQGFRHGLFTQLVSAAPVGQAGETVRVREQRELPAVPPD